MNIKKAIITHPLFIKTPWNSQESPWMNQSGKVLKRKISYVIQTADLLKIKIAH